MSASSSIGFGSETKLDSPVAINEMKELSNEQKRVLDSIIRPICQPLPENDLYFWMNRLGEMGSDKPYTKRFFEILYPQLNDQGEGFYSKLWDLALIWNSRKDLTEDFNREGESVPSILQIQQAIIDYSKEKPNSEEAASAPVEQL